MVTWQALVVEHWQAWLRANQPIRALTDEMLSLLNSYGTIDRLDRDIKHHFPRSIAARFPKNQAVTDSLAGLIKSFALEEQKPGVFSLLSSNDSLKRFQQYWHLTEQSRLEVLSKAKSEGYVEIRDGKQSIKESLSLSQIDSFFSSISSSSVVSESGVSLNQAPQGATELSDDIPMDQLPIPLQIMIFLRLKQLCFSPHLRFAQASLETTIADLWFNPAFDWQLAFIKVFESFNNDLSLFALTQLKQSGFDISQDFVESLYDQFRSFIERDFIELSAYFDKAPPDWLLCFSSVSIEDLVKDNPEAKGFFDADLWQIIINHGRFDLFFDILSSSEKVPPKWRQEVKTDLLSASSYDLPLIMKYIDQFLVSYQLRPNQYHAFYKCAQWLMSELKLTDVAGMKRYYDKNSSQFSLILDYFLFFATVEHEQSRSEEALYFLDQLYPLSELSDLTAQKNSYESPSELWILAKGSFELTKEHPLASHTSSFLRLAFVRMETHLHDQDKKHDLDTFDLIWRMFVTLPRLVGESDYPLVAQDMRSSLIAIESGKMWLDNQRLATFFDLQKPPKSELCQKIAEFELTGATFEQRYSLVNGAFKLPLDMRYSDKLEVSHRQRLNDGSLAIGSIVIEGREQVKRFVRGCHDVRKELLIPSQSNICTISKGVLLWGYGDRPSFPSELWLTPVVNEKAYFEGIGYNHVDAVCLLVSQQSMAPTVRFCKSFPQFSKMYRVSRGESIDALAKQFDTSPSLLLEINHEHCKFILQEGQSLVIPDPTGRCMKHQVTGEKDILKIADHYGVRLSVLKSANLRCYLWQSDDPIRVPCLDAWLQKNEGNFFSVTKADYRPNCVAFDARPPDRFKAYIEESNVSRHYPPYLLVHTLPDAGLYPEVEICDEIVRLPCKIMNTVHSALECLLQNIRLPYDESLTQNASVVMVHLHCMDQMIKRQEFFLESAFLDHLEAVIHYFNKHLSDFFAYNNPELLANYQQLLEVLSIQQPRAKSSVFSKFPNPLQFVRAHKSKGLTFFDKQSNILKGQDRDYVKFDLGL